MLNLIIAKPTHRLTLFYLANDVIQHAKRKGVPQYVDDFAIILKEATNLVKGDKISSSVDRVFNIWLERNIYSEEFIDQLRGLLSGTSVRSAAISKIVAEFKLSELIEKIKKLKKAEQNSSEKLETLMKCKVDATNSEVLNKLKDKTHGEQFSKDFDEGTKCLESVINALEKEVAVRSDLVQSLEKSEIFYETQKDEAKTVVDAYKNFGLRVKNVGKRLEESKNSLPSPLPSPPRDAPSPTNSDDGPNLPQNDIFSSEVNAFLRRVVSDDSKSIHHSSGSSLDQRLSSLIHSIPHMNDQQKNNPNKYMTPNNNQTLQSTQMQTNANNSIINNNSFANNNRWNTTDFSMTRNATNDPNMSANYSMYLSHQTNPNPPNNQMMYDYNYSHQTQGMNRQNNAEIQHIQSLVSSRGEENKSQMTALTAAPIISSSNLMPQFHDYQGLQQPSENFEPADMDLGNSDEEEIAINRLQTHRTLKVIDTRRNSNETQLNDFIKVNNGANDERTYSNSNNNNNNNLNNNSGNVSHSSVQYMPPSYPLSSPQLKSIARMPVQSSLNSSAQHSFSAHPSIHSPQWRGPRSTVIAPQHFSPNSLSINAPSPQHNRNWRQPPNRNNRKNNFRRY